MTLKIQHFTLFFLILMAVAVTMLWSFSLYLTTESANQEKIKTYQQNWQAQLDQLQKTQHIWLKQHFHEVDEGIAQFTDPQQQQGFINQYYLSNPQIRLIQTGQVALHEMGQGGAVSDCQNLLTNLTDLKTTVPNVVSCLSNSQPMLGISAKTGGANPQALVVLMDYFQFIREFGKLSGKNFHSDLNAHNYHEYVETNGSHLLSFTFMRGDLTLGTLSVGVAVKEYFSVWMQQAVWVIPMLLVLTLAMYFILFRALITPLLQITERIEKVVLTRRPGNASRKQHLSPGLMLLHKYCMNLVYLTKRDPLTGLNNRAIFEEHLKQAILEGKRSGRKYALVLLDINHFYKVNKTYGNYLGDGLLKQLAGRLTSGIRETDTLARLEKDNFALSLEFTDLDQVTVLVEKLYQSTTRPYTVYGRKINIGISIGVAIYPDHAQEMEELEVKGNEALQKAHHGDWPVVFTHQSVDQTDYSGLTLIQSLRQALENKDFKLVYQPVMDLKNHRTSYFEALLRWKDPEMHTKSIEKTIALAEKNQLIKPLSQWIISAACSQLQKMADSSVKIAVNLSMVDFHEENLPESIGKTLARFEVAPERLMVEITEGQFMQEPELVIKILGRLARMGISLSIDDFGTGQASLTYLKKLPVQKLKIDQSFVKDMIEDHDDRTIVEATIKLAHTLGIEVVAEGVESAEIHDLLVEMNCDFVQGYYISKPIEQKQISDWIGAQGAAAVAASLAG